MTDACAISRFEACWKALEEPLAVRSKEAGHQERMAAELAEESREAAHSHRQALVGELLEDTESPALPTYFAAHSYTLLVVHSKVAEAVVAEVG